MDMLILKPKYVNSLEQHLGALLFTSGHGCQRALIVIKDILFYFLQKNICSHKISFSMNK